MQTFRNVAFLVLVTLFTIGDSRGASAFSGCTITDGYNTTTITGYCENSCAEFIGMCSSYCNYLSGYYEASCSVNSQNCMELVDPPPAATFSCSCICW